MSVVDHAAQVEVLDDHRGVTVHVLNEITAANAAEVSAAVQSAWEEKGRPRRLILDLSGVQRVDSSGVGALMEIRERMRNANSRLVLTGLEEGPRRVMERTGIGRLFDIRAGGDDMAVVLPASRRRQERLQDGHPDDVPARKPHRALWALLWLCLIAGGLAGIGYASYPTLKNYRAQLDQVPVLSGMLGAMDRRVQAMEQGWNDQLGKMEARLNGSVRAARKQAERLVAGSEKRLQADVDQRTSELRARLDAAEAAQRETDARIANLEEQLQRAQQPESPK